MLYISQGVWGSTKCCWEKSQWKWQIPGFLEQKLFSHLLNQIKITVSSHFDIHLHALRRQQESLWKWSYDSHTASTSMNWTTHLGCTSHHTTLHEDYSRGVGKGPQPVNAARSCLLYSCQGSPLKTEVDTTKRLDWSDLKRNIARHKHPQGRLWFHGEIWNSNQTQAEEATGMELLVR